MKENYSMCIVVSLNLITGECKSENEGSAKVKIIYSG